MRSYLTIEYSTTYLCLPTPYISHALTFSSTGMPGCGAGSRLISSSVSFTDGSPVGLGRLPDFFLCFALTFPIQTARQVGTTLLRIFYHRIVDARLEFRHIVSHTSIRTRGQICIWVGGAAATFLMSALIYLNAIINYQTVKPIRTVV